MLTASRLNLVNLHPLVISIHKTPGSSRVGSGANACSFVPQNHFSSVDGTKDDFEMMKLDWRDVSKKFFETVQPNGILKPTPYKNSTGTYDIGEQKHAPQTPSPPTDCVPVSPPGVAMAAATCIHPSHKEFGVTSGRPRVVGFFDCVAQAELIACQGPYCSSSAFDRGDDYDEYGICIAYVFQHPDGASMVSNGRTFESGTIIKAGEQLPTQQILEFCHPIVYKVSGWRDTPIFARAKWWKEQSHPMAELPKPVCEMLDVIEHFTGTKVISIGNGPRGEDIIYIQKRRSIGERLKELNPWRR